MWSRGIVLCPQRDRETRNRRKMWNTSLRTEDISYILSLRKIITLDTTEAQGYEVKYNQRQT
jgi:hypothetical protein